MGTPPSDQPPAPPGIDAPESIAASVVAYTTPWCPYCISAVRMLKKLGVDFVQVDVQGNSAARQWLVQRTGRSTVPQIFVHGDAIGGYDDLAAMHASGAFERALQRA